MYWNGKLSVMEWEVKCKGGWEVKCKEMGNKCKKKI